MPAPTTSRPVFGWDIGGSNTKLALVMGGEVIAARSEAFELRHAPDDLASALRRMVEEMTPAPPEHQCTSVDHVEWVMGMGGQNRMEAHGESRFESTGAVVAGAAAGRPLHAVTMTAELSRAFLTKRAGVAFVLDAVEAAFPSADVRVFTVDGRFLTPTAARCEPLAVAASNWAATARSIAWRHPDAILVDIGTTSTDIIPIVAGHVVASGRTDPERLASGELVYTGALRTPVEAMAPSVPVAGVATGVAAEGFALSGDVHVWRGDLAPEDYTCATPDGRGTTHEAAGHRLARVVCADREMLDDAAVSAIAEALASAQEARVAEAIARVCSRYSEVRIAVVAGLGAFIAEHAARRVGLSVRRLADAMGESSARCAPAACVALLLDRARAAHDVTTATSPGDEAAGASREEAANQAALQRAALGAADAHAAASPWTPTPTGSGRPRPTASVMARGGPSAESPQPPSELSPGRHRPRVSERGRPIGGVDLVVKLGGGLLAHPEQFAAVLEEVDRAARRQRLVVVPGGGPFADVVRDVDARLAAGDDAAHWMAVLAMDQHAQLVASRLRGGLVAVDIEGIWSALASGLVPVLAPFQWLRLVDPLPHSWDVTSDSIAAWVAGALGSPRLVLVKPPGVTGPGLLDAYFSTALPPGVAVDTVSADASGLRAAMACVADARHPASW